MKGITIAPNIRRDTHGHEVCAKYRGERRYARYPLDADLKDMQAWQKSEKRAMKKVDRYDAVPGSTDVGGRPSHSLEADAPRFLRQIEGRASFKADRSHLRAWFTVIGRHPKTPLGQLPRHQITSEDVNLAIADWRRVPTMRSVRRIRVAAYTRDCEASTTTKTSSIGAYERKTPATSGAAVAVKTIRHRCRVLDELYRTLDGAEATSPVDGAKVPKPEQTIPVGVDIETIRIVARNLAQGDAQTYARFLVLATTGQRPCQVMRAEPGDVNLKTAVWVVRSAKLEPAHAIPLNAEMIAAWRTFIAAAAWGRYDTTKHAREVHAAGWPAGIRPYNARHSLMIDALAAGVPLDDVQGLAGHTSPETTRRFYGPLALPRQRTVSEKVMGRLAGVFGPARALKGRPGASGGGVARAKGAAQGERAPLTAVAPARQTRPAKAGKLPPGSTARAIGNRRK